ncbi:MAG: A/G-specific adenine glycosylase [Lachnospira sp.]|nr:A/G-specific adenine glycosylase [Lachnospira sp.]
MLDKNIVKALLDWYHMNARTLPWRENQEPYRVWVSEIMLQQTRVEAVIPYFLRFMNVLPTIEALAEVDEEQLHKLWEGLGYYSRVRNLQKAAKVICEEYQGKIPSEHEQILKLPGIGPYTAGAISSIAFGQPKAAIDGNVLRVMTRVLADDTDINNMTFRKEMGSWLEEIYPEGQCGDFTQSLIELGALICVPNAEPKCDQCPISAYCKARQEERQLQFPVKQPKKKRKIQDMTVFLMEKDDSIAICKRPDSGLLAGLWQFPNVDGVLKVQEALDWVAEQGIAVSRTDGIIEEPEKKHIFTHIEWHMHVYRIQCEKYREKLGMIEKSDEQDIGECENPAEKLEWVKKEKLDAEIALPTAFRKLLVK